MLTSHGIIAHTFQPKKKESSNLPESRSQAKLSGVGCADASPSLESNLEEIRVLYIYIYLCVCVRMPVVVYDTYVNDCKRIRCTNLFVCLYAHLYTHVYYIHFLQKVLESIPTLSKVAASLVFFSPRQASSLHRPGAISTHASPPRRLWLQPTI